MTYGWHIGIERRHDLDALLWLIGHALWLVWASTAWLAGTLFWLSVWVLLPLAIIAFIGMRAAEYFIGKQPVRLWIKKHALKYGTTTSNRILRWLMALGGLPLRVSLWLVLYTLWHSLISLLWTPRWRPWRRAWSRRWSRRRG